MSGVFGRQGESITAYTYWLDGTRNSSGTWHLIGDGSKFSSGEEHATSSGGGTYSTGDETTSTSGTISESGADYRQYEYNELFYLDSSGNWQVGVSSGQSSGSGFSHSSYSAAGLYTLPVDGVNSSGAFTQSGQTDSDYAYSYTANKRSDYTWGVAGSATVNSSGEDHSTYSGTSTFSSNDETSNSTTTSTDSGATNSSHQYASIYTLDSDGAWHLTGGTGSGSGDGFNLSLYAASGTYSSTFAGGSAAGTFTQNGETGDEYSYTFSAVQDSTGAWTSSGGGTRSHFGEDQSSFTGTSSFSSNDENVSATGSATNSGASNGNYSYTSTFTIDNEGQWHLAGGTGSGSGEGQTESTYTGDGTYSVVMSNGSVSGGFTHNGTSNSEYSYDFTAVQTADGTWSSSGTATMTSSGEDHSSYSGSGEFSSQDDTTSFSATNSESGGSNSAYQSITNYAIASDGSWNLIGATASGSGDGVNLSSYAGSGSYTAIASDGGTAGSFSQNGHFSSTFSYSFSGNQNADGNWSYTGNGTESGSGEDHSSYTGTGAFSSSDPAHSYSASSNESGEDNSNYSFSSSFTLGTDGAWLVSSGTASGGGDGSFESSHQSTGSYNLVAANGTTNGTFTQNGEDHSEHHYSFTATQNTDGSWTLTGTGSMSGDGEDHYAYVTTGSFSGGNATSAWNVASTENGADHSSYAFNSSYVIGSDGAWQVSAGSASGSGDGFSASTFAGAGMYVGGSHSDSYTQNGAANSDYQYSFNATQATDGSWAFTGSATANQSGTEQSTNSRAGTYLDGFTTVAFTETGSANSNFQATIASTMDPSGNWVASSGSGGSQGTGTYTYSYGGNGSRVTASTTPLPGGSSTTSLNESASQSGQLSATHAFSTSSTLIGGSWLTTGTATTSGSGSDTASNTKTNNLNESSQSSWQNSGSSGSSSSTQQRTETDSHSQNQTYQFTIQQVLAADGSITSSATHFGSGYSSGSHTLIAAGTSDSEHDSSTSNSTSHSEEHGAWSKQVNEQFYSNWQGSITKTSGPNGSLTTGGITGITNSTGTSTDAADNSSFSSSSSSGPGHTSQSESHSSSSANGSDNYNSTESWSRGYDASGIYNTTSNLSNHRWGNLAQSSSNNWSNTSTTTDPYTGAITTTTETGGDTWSDNAPYDETIAAPGFGRGVAGSGQRQVWQSSSVTVEGGQPPVLADHVPHDAGGQTPRFHSSSSEPLVQWVDQMLHNGGQPLTAGSAPLYASYFDPRALAFIQGDLEGVVNGPSSMEPVSAHQALSMSVPFVEAGAQIVAQSWSAAPAALHRPLGSVPGAPHYRSYCSGLYPSRYINTCFTGRMLIDTLGGRKRAKDIEVGDLVLSRSEFDPAGPIDYKEVEEVFVRVSPVLNLHVAGQVIETTPEHPFYVEERGWIPAAMLQVGDVLLTREGQRVPVEGVADSGRVETVYNWRIADWHTYFVSAGEQAVSVWAHNACASTSGSSRYARVGQDMHTAYSGVMRRLGYRTNYTLPSGRRADAVNFQARTVRELKPNNQAAIRRGLNQARAYATELQRLFGGRWTYIVDVYG